MAYERRWAPIAPRALTADGTAEGVIEVANAIDFHVKQVVFLKGTALPNKQVQINSIPSQTEIIVGEVCSKITDTTDVSAYTTAANSTISSEIQKRPTIQELHYERAVYEEEPVVAKRMIQVDPYGNKISKDNPLSVTATFDGDVNVDLDHTNDSTAIGNGVDRLLEINKNRDIDIRANGWTIEEKLKKGIMCAHDALRDYVHTEIDGVWKITEIEWTSASMDAEALSIGFLSAGESMIVRRTFTYQGVDPFKLLEQDDELEVV